VLDFASPAFPYVALCGVCLTVILLTQMAQGHSALFGLLVLLAGVTGVLLRTGLAAAGLVLLVAAGQIVHVTPFGLEFGGRAGIESSAALFSPRDLPLCAAVVGFVAGNYRLLALHRHIFPPDYRMLALRRLRARNESSRPAQVEQRRPVGLIRPLEPVLLVLALPLWALAGQVAWALMARQEIVPQIEPDPAVARVTVGAVLVVPALVTAAVLLRVWRLRRMTGEEAALLMQDHLWRETAGEQRLLTRWLAWFWLQDRQRKERR
jgi:hypothetical protein